MVLVKFQCAELGTDLTRNREWSLNPVLLVHIRNWRGLISTVTFLGRNKVLMLKGHADSGIFRREFHCWNLKIRLTGTQGKADW